MKIETYRSDRIVSLYTWEKRLLIFNRILNKLKEFNRVKSNLLKFYSLKERINMKKRKTVISLPELPLRPRNLAPDDVQTIFGGCAQFGEPCKKDEDCCGSFVSCRSYTIAGIHKITCGRVIVV
jgi:hypothetical protein